MSSGSTSVRWQRSGGIERDLKGDQPAPTGLVHLPRILDRLELSSRGTGFSG